MFEPTPLPMVQSYLAALARGDHPACEQTTAWNAFYQVYDRRIRAALRKWEVDPRDIDDLAQRVWVILLRRLPKLEVAPELGSLSAYIDAIAGHEAGHHRRRASGHRDTALTGELAAALLDCHASPASELDSAESTRELLALIAEVESHLSAPSLQIVDMRLRADKSLLEIADALGLSAGAVKMRLHRAIREVRALLRSRGIGPGTVRRQKEIEKKSEIRVTSLPLGA
jgi:RNA polymerase sigma factor (sigma-70 family)